MGIYTRNLPQLGDRTFITDGGMETTLIFHEHIDLPEFAAFVLLKSQEGYEILYNYYQQYMNLARRHGTGIVLETATWRCNPDWGKKIGESPESLDYLNRKSVLLLEHIRDELATEEAPVVISGCLGPRGDGYNPSRRMTADQAEAYHRWQVATFADTNADMVAALTLNYIDEAVGITRAAQAHGMPVCISFTLETDGRLPTGETLQHAIEAVDAQTGAGPAYYMINCAHPSHFRHIFAVDGAWIRRLRGIRGNASCRSHAELDEAVELDDGNPEEFGQQYRQLCQMLPQLTVLGGCCGTDLRHIEQICLEAA